jgi:hypothetical protein
MRGGASAWVLRATVRRLHPGAAARHSFSTLPAAVAVIQCAESGRRWEIRHRQRVASRVPPIAAAAALAPLVSPPGLAALAALAPPGALLEACAAVSGPVAELGAAIAGPAAELYLFARPMTDELVAAVAPAVHEASGATAGGRCSAAISGVVMQELLLGATATAKRK